MKAKKVLVIDDNQDITDAISFYQMAQELSKEAVIFGRIRYYKVV